MMERNRSIWGLLAKASIKSFLSIGAICMAGAVAVIPVSQVMVSHSGSQTAPQVRFEPPSTLWQDGSDAGEVPFRVVTTATASTPAGEIVFGLLTYRTRVGETCWHVALAESPFVAVSNSGGYCSTEAMPTGRHLRLSFGKQTLQLVESAHDRLIPASFTTVGGEVSSAVKFVRLKVGLQTFQVVPDNGGFLMVLPGIVQSQATAQAVGRLGKVLQETEILPMTDFFQNEAPSHSHEH